MKKPLLLIISIFFTILALIGCVKKMEKVTTILSGRVIEESQSMPLNNVNVVVTNGNQEYTNTHTGVTGTFKLDVTFDDLNENYYLYLDDGNHNKRLDLKGVGKSSYDYKDIALYKDSGGGGGGSATAPTVTTSTPVSTSITTNSATCGGNVTSDGGATVTKRGICYSTSQNPQLTNASSVEASNGGTGTFTCNLTGLTPNTKYYVKAYAINSVGTSYGTEKSFTTTNNITKPTVTTSAPVLTSITTTSATCGGNVTSDGGANVTARGVCWNTSGNPTISNQHTTDGTGTGQFTSTITGLSANTTYYVKAYATNSAGTAYGSQKSFKTNSGGGSNITEFSEGFESGIPSEWETIDADGDGNNWKRASVGMSGYSITPHSGSDFVYSESYNSTSGALTPDNYLVSPLVSIGSSSTFSFWAAAQDASWASEHFGVAVSTTSQTSASAFTTIMEWTMTAKTTSKSSRGTNEMGTYHKYTVNLSAYAGQYIYIAIRHFNCTDMFYLDVDDVELSTSGGGGSTTATIVLTAGDLWGDGSGYQMLLDDTHSLYGTTIPTSGALSTNCSGNESIYALFSHKIPTNADGNCSTSYIVINNSISITIPAGIYDWCITNPTPDDRIWIAASNGNVGGRQNDYEFVAGNTYEFVLSKYGDNDGVDVTITGGAKGKKSMKQSNEDCKISN